MCWVSSRSCVTFRIWFSRCFQFLIAFISVYRDFVGFSFGVMCLFICPAIWNDRACVWVSIWLGMLRYCKLPQVSQLLRIERPTLGIDSLYSLAWVRVCVNAMFVVCIEYIGWARANVSRLSRFVSFFSSRRCCCSVQPIQETRWLKRFPRNPGICFCLTRVDIVQVVCSSIPKNAKTEREKTV